ncbi:thymidine kinase [Rhodanobacter sp. Si-c]|uniref:Thymidine kinase n=1 Tax=Rhodanobacter lycopersici TaxID=3162487 RepID=A0ABV3QE89_9GAMM
MAKLYFYYSAMNAGKTTTLLQSAYNYHERGMRTLILTPAIDTRTRDVPSPGAARHPLPQAGEGKDAQPAAASGHMGVVASRIGLKANARRFAGDENLLALVEADIAAHGTLNCVFVDEAQFLTRQQVWQLTDVVDKLRIPVLAYGLRTDFRGELFEGSRYLLAWADELQEIKTICHSGSKATMVVRVDEQGRAVTDGPQVEIGGNDRYVSVSRAEFKKITEGHGRIELQQSVLPLGEQDHRG